MKSLFSRHKNRYVQVQPIQDLESKTYVECLADAEAKKEIYTPEEKVEYIKNNLKFCIEYDYIEREKVFVLSGPHKTKKFLAFGKNLNKEMEALSCLIGLETTVAEKYEALQQIDLQNALLAKNFEEMLPLLQEKFSRTVDKAVIQVLKAYARQHEQPETILLSECFGLDESYNASLEKAFALLDLNNIGEITSKNMTPVMMLTFYISDNIAEKHILEVCEIIDINEIANITPAEVKAIKFLLSQPEEVLESINASKKSYRPQRIQPEHTSQTIADEYNRLRQAGLSEEDAADKTRKVISPSLEDLAITAVSSRPVIFSSTDPASFIVAIQIAVKYGVTNMNGIRFLRSNYRLLDYEKYRCHKQLAYAISELEITPLEIAERMVLVAGNGNAFGHLDIFPLKMLTSIKDDGYLEKLEVVSEQIELVMVSSIGGEDLFASMPALYKLKEFAMKLKTVLENVKLHAKIIGYTKLENILIEMPVMPEKFLCHIAKAYIVRLKHLREQCIALITTPSTPVVRARSIIANKAQMRVFNHKASSVMQEGMGSEKIILSPLSISRSMSHSSIF